MADITSVQITKRTHRDLKKVAQHKRWNLNVALDEAVKALAVREGVSIPGTQRDDANRRAEPQAAA